MPRRRLALLAALAGTLAAFAACIHMTDMPGESGRGTFLDADVARTDLARELEADVRALAEEIGERNHLHPEALARAADRVERELAAAGLAPRREAYRAEGQTFENLVAEVRGVARPGEIVVVGAHYDSVAGSPGANDNASGVAALLALARRFARSPCARTLRFAAFANEEPPWFQGDAMGSLVHARGARERGERVVAMLSLETIGYYSDEEGSQELPAPGLGLVYPTIGNFVAFVGDLGSRELVREAIEAFRASADFPSEGAALPGFVPGVGWSDHWSFRQAGFPAVMVTDTAPFRYPWYHTREDTPDKLDYARAARVVLGIEGVVAKLANP